MDSEGRFNRKLYENRDDINFQILNFPYLWSNFKQCLHTSYISPNCYYIPRIVHVVFSINISITGATHVEHDLLTLSVHYSEQNQHNLIIYKRIVMSNPDCDILSECRLNASSFHEILIQLKHDVSLHMNLPVFSTWFQYRRLLLHWNLRHGISKVIIHFLLHKRVVGAWGRQLFWYNTFFW